MKCLVTGANGFIGKHLVKALGDRGDEIIKFPREDFENLGVKFPSSFDYCFHLAAYGNHSQQKDEYETFRRNLRDLFYMLEISRVTPYKAFINVSTSSVLLPHETMYSATKAGAERLCKAFVDEYGKPIVTARPASIYGAGEADFRFIPTVFRSCIMGDEITLSPEPKHDWLYVDDLVNGLIMLADQGKQNAGKSINFSTGIQMRNSEIVSIIEDITGNKANIKGFVEPRSYDTTNWKVDNTEAKELGWRQTIGLREGLEKYYAWYMGLV